MKPINPEHEIETHSFMKLHNIIDAIDTEKDRLDF